MTKLNSTNFDFVVFDFDGVLVESTTLKTQTFKDVIKEFPSESQEKFIEYHKRNGGVSRWGKFEYLLREIIKLDDEELIKLKVDELVDKFAGRLKFGIDSLGLTPGAVDLLASLEKLGKPCYIVSGAATSEVESIVKRTEIAKYFQFVLGSPQNKVQNLNFLKSEGRLKGRGIFIGDSFTDYRSAKDFNMKFVFMENFSEWRNREEEENSFYLTVKNLEELNKILKEDNEAI